MSDITTCVSSFNCLPYLKMAVHSVRKYSYFTDTPFVVHAENCTDGTNEWLLENKDRYNLEVYIEQNSVPRGIGGGMNFCASKVQTKYINFIHSDFFVSKNWDLELVNIFDKYPNQKLWVNSHRVEPNLWNGESRPGTVMVDKNIFGELYNNFDEDTFISWAEEFVSMNDFEIPKGEGVSGMIRKSDWDEIGGNDERFAPAWWEDFDLFLRMIQAGFKFVLPSKSLVYHFGSRSSHFPNDDFSRQTSRSRELEPRGAKRFYEKWGGMPTFDKFGMINGVGVRV